MAELQLRYIHVFLIVAGLILTSCYEKSRRSDDKPEPDSGIETVQTDGERPVKVEDCCVGDEWNDAKQSDDDYDDTLNNDARDNEFDADLDTESDAIVDIETDAGFDSGKDGPGKDGPTPICDPSQCPDPRIPGEATFFGVLPCCTLNGECGVLNTYNDECSPFMEGWPDSTCLDVEVEEEVIEGCCRSDGRCGHMHEELGCHQLFNEQWSSELLHCGQVPTDPSPLNPFECIPNEDPCTFGWECCRHYNYGTSCDDPYELGYNFCNTCPEC